MLKNAPTIFANIEYFAAPSVLIIAASPWVNMLKTWPQVTIFRYMTAYRKVSVPIFAPHTPTNGSANMKNSTDTISAIPIAWIMIFVKSLLASS